MSSIPVNDLSRWDPIDLAEVTMRMTEVANSGYFMRGPHTSDLEKQLGKMLNEMKVVCVGNGTDALVLSLLSLGIKPGEKVATVEMPVVMQRVPFCALALSPYLLMLI